MILLKTRPIAAGFLSVFWMSSPAFAQTLGLAEYMVQVRGQGQTYQAGELSAEGAKQRQHEADLVFAPMLDFNAESKKDLAPTITPSFQGTQTNSSMVSLGISKEFDIGLRARLSYDIVRADVRNAPVLPLPKYFLSRPRLELTQSLLKNFGGSEISARQKQAEASALAAHYGESFKLKQTVAEAEGNYWGLAVAREVVKIQEELLKRAETLHDWNKRRVGMSLADRADFLQSEAQLQLRRLELESARNEERSAAVAFNKSRRVDGFDVPERLAPMDADTLLQLAETQRSGKAREDLLAEEQKMIGLQAAQDLAIQANRPKLDVYGTYGFNGLKPAFGDSFSQALDPDFSTFSFGVRFQTPLSLGKVSDGIEGHRKERAAADISYQKTAYNQQQEWLDLNQKMKELKARLQLAVTIEKAQRVKADYEKERLKRGRSTTAQLIVFENDYSQSSLMKVRLQLELIRTYLQLRTFGAASS